MGKRRFWKALTALILTGGILCGECPVGLYAGQQEESLVETEEMSTEAEENSTETEQIAAEPESETEVAETGTESAEMTADEAAESETEAAETGTESAEVTADEAAEPEAEAAETGTESAEVTADEAAEPETGAAEPENTEGVKPEAAESETEAAEPETAESEVAEHDTADYKATETKGVKKEKQNKTNVDMIHSQAKTAATDTTEESQKETYTIQFDGNKSTAGSMDSMTDCAVGTSYKLSANRFQRKGYTFSGWNTSANGKGTAYSDKQKVKNLAKQGEETITLYAQWTANQYTISFKGNGSTDGSMKDLKKCKYGKEYTLTANAFSRTNYVFTGWNTKADGSGTSYSDKQSIKNLSAKSGGKVTLYAQWRLKKYTVKFYGNGSTSGKMDSISCSVGKSKTLTANAFKRKGYTFTGWNTKADGTGKSYKNKQSIKNLSKKDGATVKLYAQWSKKKYTITYELNKGTNDKKNPSSYTITTATISLKNPSRKGYTFKGWYLDKDCTKKITAIEKGSTGNKTLYAKWSVNKYRITFDSNGGSGSVNEIAATYGKTYTLPLCGFVREGYICTGWNTKADGSGKSYKTLQEVKNLSTKKNGSVTLYAAWSKLSETELSMAEDVVEQVNKERKSAGLTSLQTDSTLNAIAQQRAWEIAEYFSHTRPDCSSDCFTLYNTSGYTYRAAGENIAYGYTSAEKVMKAWMNSSGHKANILNSSYGRIGVGCCYANGKYYWVQNFSN
ncbi:MAG: InlB B-repeat-containing protein [Roseburia sp.]